MKNDFTENVQEALQRAKACSKELGDSCVNTGHLMVGLLGDRFSLASRVLNDINIFPEMFRDHMKKLPRETGEAVEDCWNASALEIFNRGRIIRKKLGGGKQTTTDQMLIALLSIPNGVAFECMREFCTNPEEIANEIVEAMGYEISDRPAF
jgi:ATP-dependent Clp protease ATP-binding subunit ClpA